MPLPGGPAAWRPGVDPPTSSAASRVHGAHRARGPPARPMPNGNEADQQRSDPQPGCSAFYVKSLGCVPAR